MHDGAARWPKQVFTFTVPKCNCGVQDSAQEIINCVVKEIASNQVCTILGIKSVEPNRTAPAPSCQPYTVLCLRLLLHHNTSCRTTVWLMRYGA